MAEETSTPTTETPPATGDPVAPAPTAEAPTVTQDVLNRIVGREKAEAKRKAQQELAEQLGVSVDEAKQIIEDKRKADEAAKSEVDKARDEAEQARREAEEARAQAAKDRFDAKLERRLAAAGVGAGIDDAGQREGLMARALRLIDLSPDADDEQIAAEIEQLKKDIPGLFTAAKAQAPSGVTGAAPPASQASKSPIERGRERARAARPDPDKQHDPFAAFRRAG